MISWSGKMERIQPGILKLIMFMFVQVSAQACLATRLKQVLARLVSPKAQELVVCLEVQRQTHQEVYLVEQLQAVSLDSNQLLNVSVAFLQIHVVTPST